MLIEFIMLNKKKRKFIIIEFININLYDISSLPL